MEFTQTLQSPHLVADGKLLEADDAFLPFGAVGADAVLFAGVVDDHAGAAAGAVLLLLLWLLVQLRGDDGLRRLGRVGC